MGIKFIGPSGDLINLLGNKSKAKETMKKAGVPVVPGSEGLIKKQRRSNRISRKNKISSNIKSISRWRRKRNKNCIFKRRTRKIL